jgi:hypothetical protein
MTDPVSRASTERSTRLVSAKPTSSTSGEVYDILGLPMSLAAAKAMTKSAIQSALGRAFAKLHHESVADIDVSAVIDSIEVVFLMGRYYKNLKRKSPDLSKIDRDQWSSIEGIADVLHVMIGKQK